MAQDTQMKELLWTATAQHKSELKRLFDNKDCQVSHSINQCNTVLVKPDLCHCCFKVEIRVRTGKNVTISVEMILCVTFLWCKAFWLFMLSCLATPALCPKQGTNFTAVTTAMAAVPLHFGCLPPQNFTPWGHSGLLTLFTRIYRRPNRWLNRAHRDAAELETRGKIWEEMADWAAEVKKVW